MYKKYSLIIFCAIMIIMGATLPCCSFAQSYAVKGEEITISFEEPKWTVFTRENIKDNKELEKQGVTYENMKSTMEKSSAYVVAFRGSQGKRLEVLVRAIKNKYINNMCMLEGEELTAFLRGVDETYEGSMDGYKSELCELGDYKYVKMTGSYDKGEYAIIEYLTIINGSNYLISAQKTAGFTKEERKELEAIIRDVSFQVDPKLTKNNVRAFVEERQEQMAQNSSKAMSIPEKIAATIVVIIAIILVLKFKNRKQRKKSKR